MDIIIFTILVCVDTTDNDLILTWRYEIQGP